jgi:hypothetical protein
MLKINFKKTKKYFLIYFKKQYMKYTRGEITEILPLTPSPAVNA